MAEPLPTVHLNGKLLPLEQASVSPLDRGFLFADGIYEAIPIFGGVPRALRLHLERLENSLNAIRLPNPHSESEWRELILALAEANGGGEMGIYLQVTRGSEHGRDHRFPARTQPTVFAFAFRLPAPLPSDQGLRAVLLEDQRWARCDIKSIALLPNVLARQEAAEAGAEEAILVRGDHVTEGAATTVFCVVDGMLWTPPLSPERLPSITRERVLDLARRHDVKLCVEPLTVENLMTADEVWLASSTRGVAPVLYIDGRTVGDGEPGPLCMQMRAWYDDALQEAD